MCDSSGSLCGGAADGAGYVAANGDGKGKGEGQNEVEGGEREG